MNKFILIAISFFLGLSINARGETGFLKVSLEKKFSKNQTWNIHYGVYNPVGEVKGDILYLHGYLDQFENHPRLFQRWQKSGFRVIAFDFPDHGKSTPEGAYTLNSITFKNIAQIAGRVLNHVSQKPSEKNRPLIISGWSTGGLLAVRMMQWSQMPRGTRTVDDGYELPSRWKRALPQLFKKRTRIPRLERKISGAVLHVPATLNEVCIGETIGSETLCQVTNQAVTHDQSLWNREFKTNTAFRYFAFSARLVGNGIAASRATLPKDIPILVLLAEKDRISSTKGIQSWAKKQLQRGVDITTQVCKGAYHELDNELDQYGGSEVREKSALFAERIIAGNKKSGSLLPQSLNICQ